MQIGRKLYYDKTTGNVIQDTGERSGNVIETTQEQDFADYASLSEQNPETVGMIQLVYGQYLEDFRIATAYQVNVDREGLSLLFSYPDPVPPQKRPIFR